MRFISVTELKQRFDKGEVIPCIDVREPHEYEAGHLKGTPNIPMGELPNRISEIMKYKDQELVMVCRSGGRSGQMANFLESQGFTNVKNLTGGMMAWKQYIDPTFNV